MCKYCERFNGDANNYLDRQKIDLLEGRGINQEMFLTEDQNNPGNFYLQICNNLTNEVISSVKLEYCPFCRRKLNKALEDMATTIFPSTEYGISIYFIAQGYTFPNMHLFSRDYTKAI